MLYTVTLFRPFGRVPTVEIARQVTGDAAHAQDVLPVTYRAAVVDDSFVTAVVAGVYRMVDGAVANLFVVHHLDNLGDGLHVLLRFSVQFHIGDVAASGQGMKRSFPLDFLYNRNRLLHVHMERIDIVVAVVHSFDEAVFSFVHPGETAGKSFRRGSQHGIVQTVFLLISLRYFVHFFHGRIERFPGFRVMPVPLSVECHHGVVPSDEADTQGTLVQHVAHFFIRVKLSAAFPYVVAHHERELPGEGRTLVLIAGV